MECLLLIWLLLPTSMLKFGTTFMALKIDHVAGALHIEIHPRKTWHFLPDLFLVLFWGALASRCIHNLFSLSQHDNAGIRSISWSLLTSVCALYFLYLLCNTVFGYDVVSVSPSTIEIQSSLLGMTLSRKEFNNQIVQNLRYEEWSAGRGGQQNGIRFEYNGKTITFARQAKADDSWSLIDRMCEIYEFSIPTPTPSPAVVSF
jgi:hypothetical protein